MKTFLSVRIPDLDHVVVSPADDQPPVVLDTADGGHVSDEHVETLARVHVPHPQRGVSTSADDTCVVQVHASHRARVAVQRVDTRPGLRVPNLTISH